MNLILIMLLLNFYIKKEERRTDPMTIKESIELFDTSSDFETITTTLIGGGPEFCKYIIFGLQRYETKMNLDAVVLSKEQYESIQTQFYYDIISILHEEDDDKFLLGFNILNLFFSKYKDSSYS